MMKTIFYLSILILSTIHVVVGKETYTHAEVVELLNKELGKQFKIEQQLAAWESGNLSAEAFQAFLKKEIEKGKKDARQRLIGLEQQKRAILGRQGIQVPEDALDRLEFTAEEVTAAFPTKPTYTEFDRLFGFQLGRTMEQINPYQGLMNAKQYSQAWAAKRKNPAILGFSQNLASSSETWQARGVLARPFFLKESKNNNFLITGVPAIEFDRVTGASAVDSLRFRLNATTELHGGALNYQRLNIGAIYGTDFDFDGSAWQLEFDYGFRLANGPQGRYNALGALKYRPAIKLHGEYASNLDRSKGFADSHYFRVGPLLTLDLIPNFEHGPDWLSALNSRLHANLRYGIYPTISSDNGDYELFRATLNWNLDRKGHVKLTTQYENGFVPLSGKRVENLNIGLGIAF